MNKNSIGMPATNEDEEFWEPGTAHSETKAITKKEKKSCIT